MGPKLDSSLLNYDTGHPYRVLWWTNRALTIGFACSMLFNVAAAFVIAGLFPLKTIQPMLLTTTAKGEQIVKVEPFEQAGQAQSLLTEALVQQYIAWREAIDFQTDALRWQNMAAMSSLQVNEEFVQLMKSTEREHDWQERTRHRVNRVVKVQAVSRVTDKVYQAEWESIDMHLTKEVGRQTWVSMLTIEFQPQRVRYEDRYMNPLGFTVVDYRITKKGATP